MIKQYKDKFMVWQLHNRREIVCAVVGFIVGAIIF
jgi:hypothetical protein